MTSRSKTPIRTQAQEFITLAFSGAQLDGDRVEFDGDPSRRLDTLDSVVRAEVLAVLFREAYHYRNAGAGEALDAKTQAYLHDLAQETQDEHVQDERPAEPPRRSRQRAADRPARQRKTAEPVVETLAVRGVVSPVDDDEDEFVDDEPRGGDRYEEEMILDDI